jgi:phage-related protein (TIGR01555 family)
MPRKSIARAAKREQNAKPPVQHLSALHKIAYTQDSFENFAAKVGLGTDNISSYGSYGFNPVTRIRILLEWAYRGSWICRKAVRDFADDMTKGNLDFASTLPPEQLEIISSAYNRKFQIADKFADTISWARLYGGAIAVMLIDGQDPAKPFNPNTVTKGQFCGLEVYDRWMVTPSLNDLVTDLKSPDRGKPKYYQIVADAPVLARQIVHHSRIFRFEGEDLPYYQKISENLWGLSILEPIFDRILAFDETTAGTAQLVYGARLRTLSVKGLRDIIGTGGALMDALVKQIDWLRRMQTNEGITLLDSEDKFESLQYNFTGLDAVLIQMGQQISGAIKEPLVRLFGQSPVGLNSTGESDLRTYYDGIDSERERRLRPELERLLPVIARSEGIQLSKQFTFQFPVLWQLQASEKEDIASKNTNTILAAFQEGVVTRSIALKELRQASKRTGVWTNITDKDIEEAEQEPPMAFLPGEENSQGIESVGASQIRNEPEPKPSFLPGTAEGFAKPQLPKPNHNISGNQNSPTEEGDEDEKAVVHFHNIMKR